MKILDEKCPVCGNPMKLYEQHSVIMDRGAGIADECRGFKQLVKSCSGCSYAGGETAIPMGPIEKTGRGWDL